MVVAAGSLESVLDGVAERQQAGSRPLVLVHASRTALVLGLLAAHASAAGPHPAAIILTGNKDGQLHGHAHNVLQVPLMRGACCGQSRSCSRISQPCSAACWAGRRTQRHADLVSLAGAAAWHVSTSSACAQMSACSARWWLQLVSGRGVLQSLASTGGRASSFVPILGTPLGTWHAARKLAAVNPAILPTSRRKIQEAKAGLRPLCCDAAAACEMQPATSAASCGSCFWRRQGVQRAGPLSSAHGRGRAVRAPECAPAGPADAQGLPAPHQSPVPGAAPDHRAA